MRYKCSLLLALCSLLFALCSCRFNPNIQGKGEMFLQGVWEEDSVKYQEQLLQYTKHKFTFTCDSFYVTMTTIAKVPQYADSCYNSGKWLEYAKGTYSVRNDTLFLAGTFTKANFKQKISGCYRIGQYQPFFVVKEHTPEALIFKDEHVSLNLNLKQKITCVQKPL